MPDLQSLRTHLRQVTNKFHQNNSLGNIYGNNFEVRAVTTIKARFNKLHISSRIIRGVRGTHQI